LRANHLKILDEPPVLESQATLFRSRVADKTDADRVVLRALIDRLGV
jgi:ATP phosphoribosyltransferase